MDQTQVDIAENSTVQLLIMFIHISDGGKMVML